MHSDLIALFKKDLLNDSAENVFEKYFINQEAYLFNVLMQKPKLEDKLRQVVSSACDVSKDQVYLVGSSKLGFSLNPNGLYNPVDFKYSKTGENKYKSDLDVAIVSQDLFYRVGKEVHKMTNSYRTKWHTNEYYSDRNSDLPLCYKFFEYYTKGWFRPDFRPKGYDFCKNKSYQSLKRDIYKLTSRKLTIGIYIDQFYFRNYHLENLNKISLSLRTA